MRLFHYYCLFLLALLAFSCKNKFKGEVKPNRPPETFLVVDTINRSGADRFTSNIEVRWWGTDPDGFIKSYRITTPDGFFVTSRQDTNLVVTLPAGKEIYDYPFEVQAIDNDGLMDPTPAKLSYPVKNSPPSIKFIYSLPAGSSYSRTNPTYSFPATRWNWSASDPDGTTNLKYIEVSWNDTTKPGAQLDPKLTSATIEATDWKNPGIVENIVYPGSQVKPLSGIKIPGMQINAYNILYIRAVDIVEAKSHWVASYKLFVRQQVSDVLMVNSYKLISKAASPPESFYKNLLTDSLGFANPDTLRIREIDASGYYTQGAGDNFTQSLVFNHFKGLVWFGNDAEFDLDLAQKTTNPYLNTGKLYLSTSFLGSTDPHSSFLEFTPSDSLVRVPSTLKYAINKDDSLKPLKAGWPALKAFKIIPNAGLFYTRAGAIPLYEAQVTIVGSGAIPKNRIVAAESSNANGVNFILLTNELTNLNANKNAGLFLRKALIDELKLK